MAMFILFAIFQSMNCADHNDYNNIVKTIIVSCNDLPHLTNPCPLDIFKTGKKIKDAKVFPTKLYFPHQLDKIAIAVLERKCNFTSLSEIANYKSKLADEVADLHATRLDLSKKAKNSKNPFLDMLKTQEELEQKYCAQITASFRQCYNESEALLFNVCSVLYPETK